MASTSTTPTKTSTTGLMDKVLTYPPSTQVPVSTTSSPRRKKTRSELQKGGKEAIIGKQMHDISSKKRLETSGRTIYNTSRPSQAAEASQRQAFRQGTFGREVRKPLSSLSESSMVNASEAKMAGMGDVSIGSGRDTPCAVAGLALGEPSLSGLVRETSWTTVMDNMFEEFIDTNQCL